MKLRMIEINNLNYLIDFIFLIMAGGLERVYGTEEDKVNCPFYIKIGACRYENKCLRIHSVPPIS